MEHDRLCIYKSVKLEKPKLLLGFQGWMDSGEVSTGTVKYFVETLRAERIAEIRPEGFYIENFPGTMDFAAIFRPYTKIEKGLVTRLEWPKNIFYGDAASNLIFFIGKEPNFGWKEFSECIFSACAQFGVEEIYFVGSVSGLVPHTREPLYFCSVSDEQFRQAFEKYGMRFSDYEGPAGIVTYLTANTPRYGVSMASLVATVPAYVQGNNPICIESVVRRVSTLLGVHIDTKQLRNISEEFEKRLSDVVDGQPELAGHIRKMEENYDNEIFDDQMGDLKQWLVKKGIKLD